MVRLDTNDGRDGRQGMILDRHTRLITAVIRAW
jgi:hypothetical protein